MNPGFGRAKQRSMSMPLCFTAVDQTSTHRLRQSTGESKFYAPLDRREGTLFRKICVSCYRPFGELLQNLLTGPQLKVSLPRTTTIRHNVLITQSMVRDPAYFLVNRNPDRSDRTSMIFGILYLAFQAFPYIFIGNHGFDVQSTGLAFVGLGIGMIMGTATNIALIV